MLLIALVDHLCAAFERFLDDPLHSLAGVLRPQLYQFAIRTVLAVGDQLRYEVGNVGRLLVARSMPLPELPCAMACDSF